MTWLLTSLNWYIYLLILGVIFYPLTKKIFNRFSFDFAYPFAKTLAIIFVSYTSYVLGTVKILPFNRMNLFLIIGVFTLINYFIARRHSGKWTKSTRPESANNDSGQARMTIIIFEEFLFLASFLFWTFVRSQEPSIRSLEKFMDFGFINSILRSDFFPPKDIWYTPLSINYYYFGHLTGAFLIKLTNIKPAIGYNLILSTIFALGTTQVFSLVANIIKLYQNKVKTLTLIIFGLIGAFLLNLGGNLHTIYAFTTGYSTNNNTVPTPFWKILSRFNPQTYWYPNATRFIPFTIHEFPSYSYVVADLHGHVFDIPFVVLTLAILFLIFTNSKKLISTNFNKFQLISTVFLGFLTAVHYMTNAFDGPIYILLNAVFFLVLFGLSWRFISSFLILTSSFLIFSLPFSSHFTPFITGIGVNCSPEFLTNIGRLGPFLFEKGNCQADPLWMLFVLWGFFWISFILFLIIKNKKQYSNITIQQYNNFLLILFSFGTFLIIIPEFFYIKDIYPAHFRANTMFKLGYQAFIMMGIASVITFFLIKQSKKTIINYLLTTIYVFFLFFVVIYPYFSIPSYYGLLNRPTELDGSKWLEQSYPEDKEIIDYLNKNAKEQPVILEAQGDSYTDYERISAMTGLPTVAGWWVHEWLWRGSSDVVGKRIPDVVELYQSKDLNKTKKLIKKYQIKYIVVSRLEKQKYSELYEAKFSKIAKLVLRSSNGLGALYQIK